MSLYSSTTNLILTKQDLIITVELNLTCKPKMTNQANAGSTLIFIPPRKLTREEILTFVIDEEDVNDVIDIGLLKGIKLTEQKLLEQHNLYLKKTSKEHARLALTTGLRTAEEFRKNLKYTIDSAVARIAKIDTRIQALEPRTNIPAS